MSGENANPVKSTFPFLARVTTIRYVFVAKFSAVTTTRMEFVSTFNEIVSDAEPLATGFVFTFICDVAEVLVGVTEMDVMVLSTETA